MRKKKHKWFTNSIIRLGAVAIFGGCNLNCIQMFLVLLYESVYDKSCAARDCFTIKESVSIPNLVRMWGGLCGATSASIDWGDARTCANNISFWGPIYWQGLHDFSAMFTINSSNQKRFTAIVMMLPVILPCIKCRNHISKTVSQPSFYSRLLALGRRIEFVNYIIDLHNLVTSSKYRPSERRLYPQIIENKPGEQILNLLQDHGRSHHL